jgi:hypothetical protein
MPLLMFVLEGNNLQRYYEGVRERLANVSKAVLIFFLLSAENFF